MRLIDADSLMECIKEHSYRLTIENLRSTDYGMFVDGIQQAVDEQPTIEAAAPEARVLTREELKQSVGCPCWFESSGTYIGKEGFWIIPSMFNTFVAGITMSYVSIHTCSDLGLSVYNKTWRCWTSRPTDEQRKAVKWDGKTD